MNGEDALLADVLRDLLRGDVTLTWETPGPAGARLRVQGETYCSPAQVAALQQAHQRVVAERDEMLAGRIAKRGPSVV